MKINDYIKDLKNPDRPGGQIVSMTGDIDVMMIFEDGHTGLSRFKPDSIDQLDDITETEFNERKAQYLQKAKNNPDQRLSGHIIKNLDA